MKIRLKSLFAAVTLFYSLVSLNSYADTNSETRAAALLLKYFETVVYTSSDIPSGVDAPDSSAATLRLPFIYLIAGLRALGPNTINDIKRSYSPVLAGAKDFASPEGLGMVRSRQCYIGLLRDGKQPDIASVFREAKSESLGGKHVWTWDMPPYEAYPRSTTFYFAQIGDSYFVMANNRQDFDEIANELTSAESSKAVPVAVPGWKAFSTHNYWAYRSIHRSGVTNSDAAGLTNLPPTVVALNFFADMNTRVSYFRVYSSDKTMKTIPKGLPVSELIRFQPAGAGIWQATIPLPKDRVSANNALFEVFYYFGFGVAL